MNAPIKNDNIMKNSPLIITKAEQLDELMSLIHDEYFELDDISYQGNLKVVQIPYRRIFHNGQSQYNMFRNYLYLIQKADFWVLGRYF